MELVPSAEDSPRQATPTEHRLSQHLKWEEARPGGPSDRFKYQFKIIDFGLANFDETYACGPDLLAEEVCPLALPHACLADGHRQQLRAVLNAGARNTDSSCPHAERLARFGALDLADQASIGLPP